MASWLSSRQARSTGITISSLRAFSLTRGNCKPRSNCARSHGGTGAGRASGSKAAGRGVTPKRASIDCKVKSA